MKNWRLWARPVGRRRGFIVLATLLLLAGSPVVSAVVFYSTGDPNFNTTAPTGSLAGSGWQWVGTWGAFQGAAIGPHHFLAARHIGGAVGDPFVLAGVTYTTTAYIDDTVSDLRIWQVSGTLPTWAPLYRTSDEVGRSLVVFGRGLYRGGAITVQGVTKGWYWGSSDTRLRWGQNVVAAAVDGGTNWGALLYATFDQTGGANEADLAEGDSSGPVFVNDGSGWKLAGVAATVDAFFSTVPSGNGFIASLFDARGLYYSDSPPNNWTLIAGSTPVPTGFYSTRVSVRAAWIDSVVPPADSSSDAPLLSPSGLVVLFALLAGGGVSYLRRSARRPASL